MSRQTETVHPHAYRVIETVTYLDEEGKPVDHRGYQRQWGPYATKGAAKGIRTNMRSDNERWPRTRSLAEYHIEESPAGDWNRIED